MVFAVFLPGEVLVASMLIRFTHSSKTIGIHQ